MAHYAHADSRPFLRGLGYQITLFTASNIGALPLAIQAGEFDALVLATNALHDNVIRSMFGAEEGQKAVAALLAQGGGLLVLMQYKAAYDDYPFDFLPEPFSIVAVPRPGDESATGSELSPHEASFRIPLLSYPDRVSIPELAKIARDHDTLPGVYWHYWGGRIEADWDVHLDCLIDETNPRPLLLSAKEHYQKRIVVSAIPADWQRHDSLFENLIVYVVEGRHNAAVIKSRAGTGPALDYLIATLHARKVGFRLYSDDQGPMQAMLNNVQAGVHRTVVLDQGMSSAEVRRHGAPWIDEQLTSGTLRLISLLPPSQEGDLTITGRESAITEAFQLIAPAITRELQNGYLDGSFWSTITGLQELERLPGGWDRSIFPAIKVLALTDKHDRKGSYDEVFGATVALLWLRAKTFGPDHDVTRQTASWIRARLRSTSSDEKIKALTVLKQVGILTADEDTTAREIVAKSPVENVTDIALLALLEAGIEFVIEDVLLKVIKELSAKFQSPNGSIWVDIPTTAAIVRSLVGARTLLASSSAPEAVHLDAAEQLIVPAMISIEESYHRTVSLLTTQRTYPWDGKGSTALRCLSAWYAFDKFLDAPIEETADTIRRSSTRSTLAMISRSTASTLSQLVSERTKVDAELEAANEALAKLAGADRRERLSIRRARRATAVARAFIITTLFLLYFIGDELVRTKFLGEDLEFGESFTKHFGIHFTVFTAIVALLAIPWRQVAKFVDGLVAGRNNDEDVHPNG